MKAGTRIRTLSPLALSAAWAFPLLGQDPVRAYPVGDPRPGREAPAFQLPFVGPDGAGPADQPFSLRAELGRVVVLAFCPVTSDTATTSLLRAFAAQYDSLFIGDVVVAALTPDPPAKQIETVESIPLSYKVLSDTTGRVRRLFGVERRSVAVYVVGPAGRIEWRNLRFNPFLATSYDRLREAIGRAWGTSPKR